MAFNTFITALCIALPIFQLYVGAAVLKRDVFDPPITYPTAGTVWHVGETHNVTWDTSILPSNFAGKGMIVLGFLNDTANDGNEHLDLDHPLATGFPLSSGRADITVPAVPPMDSYIVILFGDSGNASPQFTITNISINMPPSSSPSAPSSSTSASMAASSPASSPASASAGSSSIEGASSPVPGPSSALTQIPNSGAIISTTAASEPSTTPLAVSRSSTASSPTSPSSSSGSPSPSVGNSTNVTSNTNVGQIQSVSFGVLFLNVAVVMFASWTL